MGPSAVLPLVAQVLHTVERLVVEQRLYHQNMLNVTDSNHDNSVEIDDDEEHSKIFKSRSKNRDSFLKPSNVDEQMNFIDKLQDDVNANEDTSMFCCLKPRNIGVTHFNVVVVFYFFFNS